MNRSRYVHPSLMLLVLWLVACRGAVEAPLPATAVAAPTTPTVTPILPTPSPPATQTVTATAVPTLTSTATPAPTATPTVTPTPTPDPYVALSIDALIARDYGGGLLDIIDELELPEEATFKRYLITYPSDGLTIYGYMNVPNEGSKFPVVIMLHGYIPPAEYETVAYTERYANALAEAGYFVIHPNLRNYPPSDSGPDPYRIGYAIDVLNLIAIIREQSQDPTGYLRRANADDINLWGHSMGGGVALRVITVNNSDYIKTAVLYGSMSGDEWQNYQRIAEWSNNQRGKFELTAPLEVLKAISPIYYLDRIRAAISIHHSDSDDIVPLEWSIELCERLQALNHPVECFTYNDMPHTFRGWGDTVFIDRVNTFLGRH